jgi:hypothetical protein
MPQRLQLLPMLPPKLLPVLKPNRRAHNLAQQEQLIHRARNLDHKSLMLQPQQLLLAAHRVLKLQHLPK